MSIYREALERYWGYSAFRPLQEEIIESVGSGKDTLALMPTGGGKSLTFQVPAMAKEGICLVVTPLIALMKDQVENLKAKKIKALAIHSGLSREEISHALDNCIFGDFKFLYLSPERLSTDLFRARVQQMNVNLIAIDEAHCISQWGYDFRPSYMRIPELREILPEVPVLALTATATPNVAEDIMQRLDFSEKNLLKMSFERKNLVYVVRRTEDKQRELLKIATKINGTGVVYVRNRKKTREIADLLISKGISADYYHAGLKHEDRARKQEEWQTDRPG
jgi:ATP-dependent DNA helicase RecQ